MIKYRPEIDGLRTLAVIPVILFHLGYSSIKGGYMGVDVFFVISGYLITKILIGDIKNDNFSMYRFWLRRIKRLLPLLLTVILFTLLIAPLFIFKPVVKDLSKDVFPAVFSYFNFHAWLDFGNYWAGKSEQSFLLHTWSLSVEEQFYLIYPFFLYFSHKYFRNFLVPILTVTFLSLSLFIVILVLKRGVNMSFYMLPTRMWELAFGGLASLVNPDKLRSILNKNIIPSIGVCLITSAYFFGSKTIAFSVILPVIGSVLIILFCSPNDLIGRILSSKAFVQTGKISYSLYLWHWVIIVFFKNLSYQLGHINQQVINAVILLLTFLLSVLTYAFIETKLRNYLHTPKIVLAAIALIALPALFFQSNFFNPYYSSKYNRQTCYIAYYDISPNPDELYQFLSRNTLGYNLTIPKRPEKFDDAFEKEGIIENEKKGAPGIMLIGDSHGVMWARLMSEISDNINTSLSCYTSNGVTPFFNLADLNDQKENSYYTKKQRINYASSIIRNINKWNPKLIVIICRWEGLNTETRKNFNDLLLFLENKRIQVLLFTQPPLLPFMEDKNASQYFTYLGLNPVEGNNLMDVSSPAVMKSNEYIKSLSLIYSNITIYDVNKYMLSDNKIKISLGNEALYFDGDHLSYPGTRTHKENILSIMDSLLLKK